MTCDDVCPGTNKLTCTCSVDSDEMVWKLPGSTIAFDDKEGVGTNRTTDNGTFVAVVTNDTGGKESMLIYTANESLVNDTIVCEEQGISQPVTINEAG